MLRRDRDLIGGIYDDSADLLGERDLDLIWISRSDLLGERDLDFKAGG